MATAKSKKKPATKAKKTTAKKPTVKKTTTKKIAAKKTTTKKPAAKAKKPVATTTTKKTTTKKVTAKKPAAKSTAKKPVATKAKKTVTKKAAGTRAAKKTTSLPTDVMDTSGLFQPYQAKKNEDYMNGPQREHFKFILNGWKQQLIDEATRTVHHLKDEAANFPDPTDRATQEEEFSLELRTRDRERKLIHKINQTLEMIDSDDYGFCHTCGVEIGIRRLEARPTADLCIDCKTLSEIKERQVGKA